MEHSVSLRVMSFARSDRAYPWMIDGGHACRTIPRACKGTISGRRPCHNGRTRGVWCSSVFVCELVSLTCRQRLCCKWCT